MAKTNIEEKVETREEIVDAEASSIDWEAAAHRLEQENTQYVKAYNAEKQAHDRTKVRYERLLELFNVFIDKYLSK